MSNTLTVWFDVDGGSTGGDNDNDNDDHDDDVFNIETLCLHCILGKSL